MIETNKNPIGILMPKISNPEMFATRYNGLEEQLRLLGITAAFAFRHSNYDQASHQFHELNDTGLNSIEPSQDIKIVRDLTMPASDDQPIYIDAEAPRLVHRPDFNAFLRDKSNLFALLPELHPKTIIAGKEDLIDAAGSICGNTVVIKPVVGQASQGIYIGDKTGIPNTDLGGANFMVQEYINTTGGVKELEIKGAHNVRILLINSEIIGAIGRLNNAGGKWLHGEEDVYGKVYLPEELPQTMLYLAEKVKSAITGLPDGGRTVVVIDLMRGINADDEQVDVLCEVNRRPMRISKWDLKDKQIDPIGVEWLAGQWDKAEAKMLDEINTNG